MTTGSYFTFKPNEFRFITCPTCPDQAGKFLFYENEYRLARCQKCGLVMVNPQPKPDHLKNFYQNYFLEQNPEIWLKATKNIYRNALNTIQKFYAEAGKLLDVGSGFGFFLDLMRSKGWETLGLEPDPIPAQYAQQKLHLDIIPDTLETASLKKQDWDLVSLWWVLEHTRNPAEVLHRIYKILKPGGIVLIRVPNIEFILLAKRLSFLEKITQKLKIPSLSINNPISDKKSFFNILDPPHHLFGFSPKSLRKLLQKTGFEIITVQTGKPLLVGNILRQSMEYALSAGSEFFQNIFKTEYIFYHDLLTIANKPETRKIFYHKKS